MNKERGVVELWATTRKNGSVLGMILKWLRGLVANQLGPSGRIGSNPIHSVASFEANINVNHPFVPVSVS